MERHAALLGVCLAGVSAVRLAQDYPPGKDAPFVPRGLVDTEEAVSGSPRAVVIELK